MPNHGQFASWDDQKRWAFASLPMEWRNLPTVGFTVDDVTSPWTIDYNCIAYAAKDDTQPWWPMPIGLSIRYYHWPPDLPREDPATKENFFRAFEKLEYKRCKNGKRQYGYEKVALYVDGSDVPTHMARELGDGIWHSKLGDFQDIRHHALEAAETVAYGTAKYFMRKRIKGISRWAIIKGKLLGALVVPSKHSVPRIPLFIYDKPS